MRSVLYEAEEYDRDGIDKWQQSLDILIAGVRRRKQVVRYGESKGFIYR